MGNKNFNCDSEDEVLGEIKLVQGRDGKFHLYKEPYASIECETEEDFERAQFLIGLGLATEKMFKDDEISGLKFSTVEELILHYRDLP